MSEIGPKQGSLFSTAARRSARTNGDPAKPHDERVAPAAGAGRNTPGAPAAVPPRPLYIGPVEEAAIKALIERARSRPVLIAEMQRRAAELKRGITPPKSLNREFTIKIPEGFTATYTHEEQPIGWTRHLSIATDRGGRAPHPVAVDWLLREFGFRATKLAELDAAWFEPIGNGRQAINLVETLVALEPAIAEKPDNGDDYIFDDSEPVTDNC